MEPSQSEQATSTAGVQCAGSMTARMMRSHARSNWQSLAAIFVRG